jgi:hypothetical protein
MGDSTMKIFFLLASLVFSFSSAQAEEKLGLTDTVTEIPGSAKTFLKKSFSKESLPAWGIILGSTALTYHYDEEILRGSQKLGRQWHIGNDDHTKTVFSLAGYPILRLPSDLGSTMYFFGDGWLHSWIAGGFLGVGHFSNNTKAFNTGIMLVHGMMVSTIFNQILKRSFGRETPVAKTKERGAWRPFPSFKEYGKRTASYDAMPSGHVMTLTHTMVVLGEQYPESGAYIYSVGGVMLAALSYQMINNGVHWASDYPLGIAMGYVFGKISSRLGKAEEGKAARSKWTIFPSRSESGVPTINAMLRFH